MADPVAFVFEILGAVFATASTAAAVVWRTARKLESLRGALDKIQDRLKAHDERHDKHEEEDSEFAKGLELWMRETTKTIGQIEGRSERWNEPTRPGIGHGGRDRER